MNRTEDMMTAESNGNLLELVRSMYEMLEAADHIVRQAEGMAPETMEYLCKAWGWDQSKVDRLLVAALRHCPEE